MPSGREPLPQPHAVGVMLRGHLHAHEEPAGVNSRIEAAVRKEDRIARQECGNRPHGV